MPTNVIEAGHARTYGSPWSTAGTAINEGLGQVLGYYQEYQRQKRFELQQTQEAKLKAQEMAERAEDRKYRQEDRLDAQNSRKAQQAELDVRLLTPEQALAMPEYTQEVKTMVPKEMLNLTTPADPELGIAEQTTQLPSFSQKEELKKELLRTKKFGDYTAVLDYGGEQARRAKQAERIDSGQAVKATPELTATLDKLGLGHFTDVVPATIMGLYQQHMRDAQADDRLASTERIANARLEAIAAKGNSSGSKSYKAVYDKQAKTDVMANDEMISQDPGRYGPPKKEGGSGKPLLAGEIDNLAAYTSGMTELANLMDEAQDTGTVAWAQSKTPNLIAQYTGWGVDAKSRQAALDAAKQSIGKAMEGGVLRKEDEAKYIKILPTLKDAPEVARRKIRDLISKMRRDSQNYLSILESAGRDTERIRPVLDRAGLKAEELAGMRDPYDDIAPSGGGGNTAGKKDPGGLR